MVKTEIHTGDAHWYLFLLSPFLAVLMAIKNYKASWSKNIIWAFVVFFGFTFGTAKETSDAKKVATSDIFRSFDKLQKMHKKYLSFDDIVKYYQKNKDVDVVQLTIFITVSRFTDEPKILLIVYGLIFGFFFSRNIWFLLNRLEGKIKFITLLLLATFILVNPFWNINGFRFWTATHIYIYGLLPYLFEKKKKGLLISALSFFVHFSFIIPVAILGLYLLLGNRTVIFFGFFVATTITSQINIAGFNAFVEANAPAAIAERTESYRSEQYVGKYRTGATLPKTKASWHVQYYNMALSWSLIIFLSILFFRRKSLNKIDPGLLNILSFTFLFWGIANLFTSLPSGGRFVLVAWLAALPPLIFYVHYQTEDKYLNKLTRIAVFPLLLFIIVATRIGLYSLTLNTFISNPIISLFADYNFALNDFIK